MYTYGQHQAKEWAERLFDCTKCTHGGCIMLVVGVTVDDYVRSFVINPQATAPTVSKYYVLFWLFLENKT
jgi:hypothetical protein